MKAFLYITIFACVAFSSSFVAQTHKTGTTAAQVLKLNVGPRAMGMGGAYTASSMDILGMYWNPGGLSYINSAEAMFTHNALYADAGISYDYAAIAARIEDIGVVGGFVGTLSTEDMLVRTETSPLGTGQYFKFTSLIIGVSFARNLTDNFSIGFNAKYVGEQVYNMSASAFALDIGTMYKIPILNEFRIASCISNFGSKMKLDGRDILEIKEVNGNFIHQKIELDEFDLPLTFRVGVAADLIKTESNKFTFGVDAVHPNDHTEYINFGGEYAWNDLLFLRAGYNSTFEYGSEKGLTLGFGVNIKAGYVQVKADYAYQSFGVLSDIQYISVGVSF